MNNELLLKLIKKVNFDYVKKFEIERAKELSFVPINIQAGTFFVAISQTSKNKDLISNYVKSVLNAKVDFIYLTQEHYNDFFEIFLNKCNSEHNIPVEQSVKTPEVENKAEEVQMQNVEVVEPEKVQEIQKVPENKTPQEDSENKEDTNTKIAKVQNPKGKKIGEILVEEGLITEKQLTIALAEAKATDTPLGSVLVKLNFVQIKDLKDALSAQQGIKLASSDQLKALPEAVQMLNEEFVKTNKVIPLSVGDNELVVGMVNPGDTLTINEIVYQTGLKPTVVMITHFEFEKFIEQYYRKQKTGADKILNEIKKEGYKKESSDTLWEQVDKEIQDTTGVVSKFANKIITMAIDQKASDIHIEPRFEGYVVRYRTDGILKEVLKIPVSVDSAIISRFKVLSRMNIAEHRRPQDGNFTIKYEGSSYDFRINTLPVGGKEKMVIRILAPASSLTAEKSEIKIDGMSEQQLQQVKDMSSMPNGIILTSGPTGSGKTTTLYSLIKALNDEKINITTIEDPVEIKLEGINQSAMNAKAGITFANSMRAILRQDPDIILVGEIRDMETLEVAISAALTGHLVLSTIHTNSAAATVTRMVEMGAKDYLVASTLTGVLAQRLVRRLCPNCKEAYHPTIQEAKKVLLDPVAIEEFTKTTIYRSQGCPQCEDKGYKGRLGLYEVMTINKIMRKLISQGTGEIEIEEQAIKNGMMTLQESCLMHIKNGLTTVDEFVRVLGLATN